MEKQAISICLVTELNKTLEDKLFQHRTELESCASLEEAESKLGRKHYCLIVFDVSAVTTERALRSLALMRRLTYAPILLLAPMELGKELIKAGADCCISTSASPDSLTLAALSLLRRYTLYDQYDETRPMNAVIYRRGIAFDHLHHQVTLDGEQIHLTPKEYKLLYYFVRNPGILFSADQICDSIWGVEFDENRDVTTVIAELRHKLKDTREHPVYIQTIHGFGYKFLPEE